KSDELDEPARLGESRFVACRAAAGQQLGRAVAAPVEVHAGDDVLNRGEVTVEADVLKGPGHAHRRDLVRPASADVDTVETDFTAVRAQLSGHQVDQCGLAGAVGADETGDGSPLNVQR